MTVKELIELLQNENEDATVVFYNSLHSEEMDFREISVTDDNTEIYINII